MPPSRTLAGPDRLIVAPEFYL